MNWNVWGTEYISNASQDSHQWRKLRWSHLAELCEGGSRRGEYVVFASPDLCLSSAKSNPFWSHASPTKLQYHGSMGAANPVALWPWGQECVCNPKALESFPDNFQMRKKGRVPFSLMVKSLAMVSGLRRKPVWENKTNVMREANIREKVIHECTPHSG